jgi:tripartite-type tricarboxylate transporter receptor subunit TctC
MTQFGNRITRYKRWVNLTSIAWTLLPALLAAGFAPLTWAQTFPSKPLRIIVPVAAGGNLDLVTRTVAQKLTEQLGQQVIVDNRGGGNGIPAADFVMKAGPDGYTYLAIANTFVSTPAVLRSSAYDPVKDFTGVSTTAWLPQILVTNTSLPAGTVKELIALARRRPNELTYGTAGTGSTGHVAAELFNLQAGIKLTHVPYKGNAPALVDVIGGQISMMFDTISTSIPYVKAGKIKALGVTSPKRSPVLPEVPTVSEAGLPGYEAAIFNAIAAPAGTPREILVRMHAEIAKAVQQQDIRSRFLQQGVELTPSESADQCSAFLKAETEKYNKLVKQAGIKAD